MLILMSFGRAGTLWIQLVPVSISIATLPDRLAIIAPRIISTPPFQVLMSFGKDLMEVKILRLFS